MYAKKAGHTVQHIFSLRMLRILILVSHFWNGGKTTTLPRTHIFGEHYGKQLVSKLRKQRDIFTFTRKIQYHQAGWLTAGLPPVCYALSLNEIRWAKWAKPA